MGRAGNWRKNMLHKIITTLIILNLFVFGWGLIDHEHHHLFEILHTVFLVIFLAEVAYRWVKVRKSKKRPGGWLVFDTTVILLCLLPVLGLDAALMRVTNNAAKFAHTLRHIDHLRVFDLFRIARLGHMARIAAHVAVKAKGVDVPATRLIRHVATQAKNIRFFL